MPDLLITTRDQVRTLTLNRPERRNALTPALIDELTAALTEAAETCRIVILTAAGSSFCAGLDISAMQAMDMHTPMQQAAEADRIARLFRTLHELPIPTIAAVTGPAIAGGCGLATLCDFTLAVPTAKFAYTEVRIGFLPALVSAYLTLQIGEKRARDLLLTGRVFAAEEAHRLGLVTEIVAPESLTHRVEGLSTTLLANSPASLRATKALLIEQQRPWLERALSAAAEANAQMRQTPDCREGLAAFLEKRPPVWHG